MDNKYQIQKKIFFIACDHFPNIIKTLSGIEKLNQRTLGLEGWFRIELAKAIEHTDFLVRICNRGADLKLKNGEYLELKAAANLNFNYILDGAKNHPCLFLGKPRGQNSDFCKEKIELEFKKRTNASIQINRLYNNWYIGLIYNI
jgi:hypothetical protein